MDSNYVRNLASLAALAFVAAASFTTESFALIRPSGRISIKTTQSTLQAINAQPTLHCNLPGAPPGSCWTKAKYIEHARQQGWIDSNNQIVDRNQGEVAVTGGDFIMVPGGQWNVDFVRPPTAPQNQNTPTPRGSEKRFALGLQSTIKDPSTGGDLTIDGATKAGRDFARRAAEERAQAAMIAGVTATHAQSFVEKERQFDQQRERFQNHLQQANAESQRQLEELRQYTAQVNAASAESRTQGLALAASGLLSSGLLTSEERAAFAEAEKLVASDLRSAEYSLDEVGAQILERDFEKQMAAGQFQAAAKTLEILDNATVDGQPRLSKTTSQYTNPSGIMKVGGIFDQRALQVSTASEEGQIVRRMMNRYQAMWAESNGLMVLPSEDQARYMLGAVALSVGEGVLANGDSLRGAAMLELSEVMIESVMGFGVGFGKSVEDLVQAVPEIAKLVGRGAGAVWNDPASAWEATLTFATNLDEVGAALLLAVNEDYKVLKKGSPYERGELAGRYAIDIVSLVASGGTVSAIKRFGALTDVGESLQAAAKATKAGEAISRATQNSADIAKAAERVSYQAVKGTFEKLDVMPEPARLALSLGARKNPQLVADIAVAYTSAVRNGLKHTADYVTNLATTDGKGTIPKDIARAVKFHKAAMVEMKTIPRASYDGNFSRAIKKTYVENGVVKTNEASDVFSTNRGNLGADHRITGNGNQAIYMTEGTLDTTISILAREARDEVGNLIFQEKRFKVDNLLDLRNAEVRNRFEILEPGLDFTGEYYGDTQIIGHAARSSGFDGVLYFSAKDVDSPITNLVLFQ